MNDEEEAYAEKLSQDFNYTDSKDINAHYKGIMKTYDTRMRVPLKKAIIHAFRYKHLPKNIGQEAFNKGFLKSGNAFVYANFFEFMGNSGLNFTDDELEPLFKRVIKHGKKSSLF